MIPLAREPLTYQSLTGRHSGLRLLARQLIAPPNSDNSLCIGSAFT